MPLLHLEVTIIIYTMKYIYSYNTILSLKVTDVFKCELRFLALYQHSANRSCWDYLRISQY
jgi:hypothetical protein